MGLFGRKSRKELIAENEKLKSELEFLKNNKPPVCTIERNIQKVCGEYKADFEISCMPESVIKEHIAHNIIKFIKPFIEYDFTNDIKGNMIYRGSLYIATGDRKNG